MEIGDEVLITDGEHKGDRGIIVGIYEGWNFIQYTIADDDNEYIVYHNQVKELNKSIIL